MSRLKGRCRSPARRPRTGPATEACARFSLLWPDPDRAAWVRSGRPVRPFGELHAEAEQAATAEIALWLGGLQRPYVCRPHAAAGGPCPLMRVQGRRAHPIHRIVSASQAARQPGRGRGASWPGGVSATRPRDCGRRTRSFSLGSYGFLSEFWKRLPLLSFGREVASIKSVVLSLILGKDEMSK